jgi:prepilin-type N-terminal cleavage/methylation domain-containing protein
MKIHALFNKRGITLIELLVALVICGIVIAGMYRVMIAQNKAYTVQDQVVEVQQNIRNAMEIMVRDLRMNGFDYDNSTSLVQIPNTTSLIQVTGNSITVEYEYYSTGPPFVSRRDTVAYTLNGSNLQRQVTGVLPSDEVLLENVDSLELTCGVDGRIFDYTTQDGVVDNWVPCGNIDINRDKVIAVRVSLTAKPAMVNPDIQQVSPRTLTSTVALRNISMKRM